MILNLIIVYFIPVESEQEFKYKLNTCNPPPYRIEKANFIKIYLTYLFYNTNSQKCLETNCTV